GEGGAEVLRQADGARERGQVLGPRPRDQSLERLTPAIADLELADRRRELPRRMRLDRLGVRGHGWLEREAGLEREHERVDRRRDLAIELASHTPALGSRFGLDHRTGRAWDRDRREEPQWLRKHERKDADPEQDDERARAATVVIPHRRC